MRTLICTLGAAGLLMSSTASADILHNNGGMITHPGAGPSGQPVSMSSPAPNNTAGSNILQQGVGPHFRVADDFAVTGPGWIVSDIVTHAYQTGLTNPGWTGGTMNIWSGRPGDAGSAIVHTVGSFSGFTDTGILRTFNGVTNDLNRRIHAITWNTGNLALAPGNYWIDWNLVGGASAWAPYVMLPDPQGGNNTITVFQNGRQMFNASGEWQDALASPGVEFPFIVNGQVIPEPTAALAVLGLGGLMLRRRKA